MKQNKLTPAQQERANQLLRMTPKQWDAICKHCGLCCLFKLECLLSNRTRYLDMCCEHLNMETHKCNIYDTRTQKCQCHKITVDDVLANEILPATCGYIEYVFGPAPRPINVDFTKINPTPDDIATDMGYFALRAHTIAGSKKWNRR